MFGAYSVPAPCCPVRTNVIEQAILVIVCPLILRPLPCLPSMLSPSRVHPPTPRPTCRRDPGHPPRSRHRLRTPAARAAPRGHHPRGSTRGAVPRIEAGDLGAPHPQSQAGPRDHGEAHVALGRRAPSPCPVRAAPAACRTPPGRHGRTAAAEGPGRRPPGLRACPPCACPSCASSFPSSPSSPCPSPARPRRGVYLA